MSSTTLTIDQLCLSPFNVRTYRPDAEQTTEMEASILADGLHNPIIVHPMKRSKTKWGAVAGGRRYRSIRNLIGRGALPADWAVRVSIIEGKTDAELLEISMTENLIRKDLRLHELCAGVARAAANGHDVDQIAANLGQDPALVRRWLRIGRLAAPVFDAFATGRLSIDQARAYAATADQALQAATFARLGAGHPAAHSPEQIRFAMKVGDRENTRLLRYVGDETYRLAGGRFELDLFADAADDRGIVVDEGILQQLVNARLEQVRDEIRTTTGRRDLRFVPKPPQTDFDTDDRILQIEPTKTDKVAVKLPDGDVVACIQIDAQGEQSISYWWASRKAKFVTPKPGDAKTPAPAAYVHTLTPGAAIDDSAAPGARRQANAAIKEEAGLSADAIDILRAMRRAILRAALVRDADRHGDVAVDYLVWAQLRLIAGADQPHRIGMQKLHSETIGGFDLAQRARAQIEASGALKPVNAALQDLTAQSFFTREDLQQAFLDFRAAPARLKRLAAAVVAGFALERSLAWPGYGLPIHDAVAADAGAEDPAAVRQYWTPTTELVGLTPRAQRADLAEELVDDATRKRWSSLRTDQLTDAVLGAVTADPDWVHPLLRFAPVALENGDEA